MILPNCAIEANILENKPVSPGVYQLTVAAEDIARAVQPGQFIQVLIERSFLLLRRPFGAADTDPQKRTVTMFYRLVGNGTRELSRMKKGETINCLGPLGHGFDVDAQRPLLIGGGMGLAPLLLLARNFAGTATVLIGGKNRHEVFWSDLFRPLCADVLVTTDDGSAGLKGFPTDLLPSLLEAGNFDRLYVCGPQIMMEKISEIAALFSLPCQVSLERHMACGLGACLSCGIDTKSGQRKKVCKDGPVFWAEEVL